MRDLKKWTPAQQDVIKYDAGNLLVSASAGSGKTSVLIEKIINLILEGNVKLKNLLVVTFTNSASAEIKMRLKSAIEESKDKNLISELEDISTSDILTFDSFCIKVVREFGYEIGRSNSFSVADPTLAGFLQNQALDNIFAKHNKNYDEKFMNFLETFFAGRTDKSLKSSIIELFDFLRSKSADFSYKDLLEKNFQIDDNNPVLILLNNYILELKDYFCSKVKNLYAQSLAFGDEKVSNALFSAENYLDSLTGSFLKNYEILKDGFNIAPPKRDKERDIAEIYDIKGEYLECKAEFTKKLSLIFTTEIKKLPISKMQDDLFKTKETLSKLFDVVDEFDEEYTRLKQNYDILDFCDIETLANRILKNKVIAESLQNRYDWIFIDEYQDTSLLQEDIVKKITTNENLFMVGDLKQSIYRFRQAEPQIFINKYRQYKDMKSGSVIELKTNFRSEIDILEFDNFIFDHIYTQSLDDYQYKNNADLEYGRDDKQKNADKKVKLIVVEKIKDSKNDGSDESGDFAQNDEQSNAVDGSSGKEETDAEKIVYSVKNSEIVKDEEKSIETEAMILADEITKITKKNYYDAKSKTYKPIKFGDIAVLLRSGKDLFLQVGKILQKAGIPIQTSLEENLFDSIDMQILLNILKTIENQKDDIPLLSAMVNIGHFSFDELALIRSVFKEEKFFYNAVDLYALNHNDDLSTKIKAFFVKIDGYKRISQYMTISELILEIVAGEKLDEHFTINQYCKNFDSHLNLLLASIKSINQYSLSEFVDYVDTFADSIKIQNNVKDAENAVTISTIHASKGLEYPVVFLIGCGKNLLGKHDGMLSMDNDWGIAMNSIDAVERTSYKSLIKIGFEQKIKQETLKEEKRLLYVALTRPKNYLTIIGTEDMNDIISRNSDYDIKSATSYMQWILGCFDNNELDLFKTKSQYVKKLQNSEISLEKLDKNIVVENEFKEKTMPEQLKIDSKDFIEILSQQFKKNDLAKKNSVSQILSEEEHYNITDFNYLKNDKFGDEDFLFVGTAYHKYMEQLDFNSSDDDILAQIKNLNVAGKISIEESSVVDNTKILRAINHIKTLILPNDIVLKEQQFLSYMPADRLIKTNKQNKILVQGVADLIIIKNDEIYLIDYKTSRIKDVKLFKEKYATQLDIYAKAIESFYEKPVTKKMIYSFYLDELVII